MTKAFALVSGGLDSILAAKIVKDQGIEVVGICFKSAFFDAKDAIRMCEAIDIPLKIIDFTEEHINMTLKPKHGYGKNMNPCIDCHTMMLNYAGKLLEELNYDFLITGEVLNQRPMSQNSKSLDIVKKESGYEYKILRPLSAKNLPPTIMEINGIVDREKLLDIKGKSRKVQMELAKKLCIEDYPSPAGGCKLTEPGYSRRLRDLYENEEKFTINDIELLSVGRHFRVSKNLKIISTRDEGELEIVKALTNKEDYVFNAELYNGSMVILRGIPTHENICFAAAIAARYSKGSNEEKITVKYKKNKDEFEEKIVVAPAKDDYLREYLL